MTKENLSQNTNDAMLGTLDDLMEAVLAPCKGDCPNSSQCESHNNIVNLVRYLVQLTRSIFKTQNDIQVLLLEIGENQRFLVRSRKIVLWGLTVVGAGILAKWGEAIFLAIKTASAVAGTPTP